MGMVLDVEKFVREFETSVAGQIDAIMRGDRKLAQRFAHRCIRSFEKLLEQGDVGRNALAELFNNNRPDVRATAATFLLKFKTDEAIMVLEEVSRGEGFIPFQAKEALKRWEEGSWSLDL
jgi:hypothetical protein